MAQGHNGDRTIQIANGSLFERQTQLEIASHPGFVSNHDFEKLTEQLKQFAILRVRL